MLASNTEYKPFLAASTKAEDVEDSNQNIRIRVDVLGTRVQPVMQRQRSEG